MARIRVDGRVFHVGRHHHLARRGAAFHPGLDAACLVARAGRRFVVLAICGNAGGWLCTVDSGVVTSTSVRAQPGAQVNDRQRITRDDLEQRFQALQDDVTEITETKKTSLTVLAVAGIAAGLLVAYLFGRRGGKRRRGVIEIRR